MNITDFATYEQSLMLAKIFKYDEKCSTFWNGRELDFKIWDDDGATYPQINQDKDVGGCTDAPLKSNVFKWFRKTYKLSSHCDLKSVSHLGHNYYFKIVNFADFIDESTTLVVDGFETIEEAESACIDRLITLVG